MRGKFLEKNLGQMYIHSSPLCFAEPKWYKRDNKHIVVYKGKIMCLSGRCRI